MGSLEPPQVGSRQRRARPGKIDAPLGNRLAAAKWGEFKVTDIFTVRNTHCILSADIVPGSGTTPYLCASAENNAVSSYIDYKAELREPGNCIFIGGKTFVVSYQESDFFSNDSHNLALYLNDGANATKPRLLFMASCIARSLGHKYTWGDSISKQKIKEDFVTFPVTAAGEIDFAFMESFMRELEEERMRELSAYLAISGLDDATLTATEEAALLHFKDLQWQEFNVTDIFNVKNTHNILSCDIVKDSGEIPYLCASAENNAVSSYISYDADFLENGNCIFIGGKTFVVSYQESDFFSNDSHNLALYLKNSEATKLNQLYLAACISKSLAHKYSWGDSISKAKIQKDVIMLPVKNGAPDYAAMETFMRAVQKLVVRDVVAWKDREIATTRQVVDGSVAEVATPCILQEIVPELRFRGYLPLYSLKAACSKFGEGEAVACESWVKVGGMKLDDSLFVVRATGHSMEPKIQDGDLCIMRARVTGTRHGKIVLAQHRSFSDPETGGAYSIKCYSSEKQSSADNSWHHTQITLSPLNHDYPPIVLNENEGDYSIVAEFIRVLHEDNR